MLGLFKRLIVLLCAGLLFTQPAAAQWVTKAGAPAKQPKEHKSEPARPKGPTLRQVHPALWKISGPNSTIYLFGSIHVLPDNVSWLNGKVETALREFDTLVTEIPDPVPADMQAIVMKTAVLPRGKTLHSMLEKDDAALLDKTLANYQVQSAMIDPFEPWYAALYLADLPLSREKYKLDNGVEAQLSARSKQLGQSREALETMEYQLSIFDRLPPKLQIRYLHEVMTGLPSTSNELKQLIGDWSNGRVDELAKLINEDEQLPELAQVLLYNRNRAWAEWISKRLQRPGKVFIAVGAGHLAGSGSVQAYLAKGNIFATRVQ